MRKIILACVAAIFSLSFINAQEVAATPQEEPALAEDLTLTEDTVIPVKTRNFLLGATLGLNMTTYSNSDNDLTASFGLGGQIGISCDVPLSVYLLRGYFSINPELIFAYQTVGLEEKYEGVSFKSTDRIYSMNIPVHLKWNKSAGPGFFYVAAGPMLNMGLGGTNKWEQGVDMKVGEDKDGKDIIRTFDRNLLFQADPDNMAFDFTRENALYNILNFSLNFKLGYEFESGLSFSAAYQLGVSNMINKAPYDDYNRALRAEINLFEGMTQAQKDAKYNEFKLDVPTQKSSSIVFSIGYVF